MAKQLFFVSTVDRDVNVWSMSRSAELRPTLLLSIPNGESTELADRILTAMKEAGYRNEPIVVGLDSHDVLSIDTPVEAKATTSSSELKFLLEEHCPIDAENIVAETVGHVTLIAMRDKVEPLMSAMIENGIRIQSVVPNAVLVCDELRASNWLADEAIVVVDNANDYLDTVVFNDGELERWSIVHSRESLTQDVAALDKEVSDRIVFIGDNALGAIESSQGTVNVQCGQVRRLLTGKADASVNFVDGCYGKEASNPLKSALDFVLVSAAFLAIGLAASFFLRSQQLAQEIRQADEHVATLLANAAPNRRPTRMVKRALESEKTKLMLEAELVNEVKNSRKIHNTLFYLLKGMPGNVRFALDTIILAPNQVSIEGRTLNQADYESLKSSLEQQLELEKIGPVRLEENELSFRLEYRLQETGEK